ncbi:MAG TPA: lipoyl(octanoyl) transferase LipB [Candidatus Atribacteria bacterium]|nr:lipoyl(octanoyl) transferase LipB [Candidatus Atribacteria bacterium]
MEKLWFVRGGQVDYSFAHRLQLNLREKVERENIPGFFLLMEHPPVFTLGRGASRSHLLVDESILEKEGIKVYEIERGGDITYHGSGQIVGYPIINLDFWERDVHLFLRALEEVLIHFLKRFEVEGFRLPPYTGVWVNKEIPQKIAAIGVAVKKWITYHGFALNISTFLPHFNYIIPCGISDKGVTSLERITGNSYSLEEREEMEELLAQDLGEVLGFKMEEISRDDFFLGRERRLEI